MKLISWNVNGLRAILSKGNLIEFMNKEKPDIMAFQETKMQEEQLTFNFDGYYRYMNCAERKGYSGTMVLTKEKPLNVIYDFKGKINANLSSFDLNLKFQRLSMNFNMSRPRSSIFSGVQSLFSLIFNSETEPFL